jgi:regulator of nonsense transcripts 2
MCTQLLLDDFAGHNIEATAALLDTAGRFLYRTPETHERMATMAEVRSPSFIWHIL